MVLKWPNYIVLGSKIAEKLVHQSETSRGSQNRTNFLLKNALKVSFGGGDRNRQKSWSTIIFVMSYIFWNTGVDVVYFFRNTNRKNNQVFIMLIDFYSVRYWAVKWTKRRQFKNDEWWNFSRNKEKNGVFQMIKFKCLSQKKPKFVKTCL